MAERSSRAKLRLSHHSAMWKRSRPPSTIPTPHVGLSCGGEFSCISVQDVINLLGIFGMCAECSHMRSTLKRNILEA